MKFIQVVGIIVIATQIHVLAMMYVLVKRIAIVKHIAVVNLKDAVAILLEYQNAWTGLIYVHVNLRVVRVILFVLATLIALAMMCAHVKASVLVMTIVLVIQNAHVTMYVLVKPNVHAKLLQVVVMIVIATPMFVLV